MALSPDRTAPSVPDENPSIDRHDTSSAASAASAASTQGESAEPEESPRADPTTAKSPVALTPDLVSPAKVPDDNLQPEGDEPLTTTPSPAAVPGKRRRRRAADTPRPNAGSVLSPDQLAPAKVVVGCRAALQRIGGATVATIGVTSCQRGEGRSVVAAGAAAVERFGYGRKTVLVEFDLEKPSLARRLGLKAGPGVAELIGGDARLDQCLEWLDDDLAVLVAGDPRAGGQVTRAQAAAVMAELRFACEVAVLDLPPLSTSGLAPDAMAVCSKVLLVVRTGFTPAPLVREAVAGMAEPPAILLNRTSSKVPKWLRTLLGQ